MGAALGVDLALDVEEPIFKLYSKLLALPLESGLTGEVEYCADGSFGGVVSDEFGVGALTEGELDQPNQIRGMVVMGHGGNTVTRMPDMLKGLELLDLLVIVDAHPTSFAAVRQRQNGTYTPVVQVNG